MGSDESEPRSDTALDQQMAAFLGYLKAEKRAALRTQQTYARDLSALRRYVREQGLAQDADALEVRHLRGYLASLIGSNSPATLCRKIAALRSFYRFAMRRGLVRGNPAAALRLPKQAMRLPDFLSVDDACELVELPAAEVEQRGALALRDAALLELLYAGGLRVSELTGLSLERLELDEGSVRVHGKGGRERIVPIGSAAVRALQAYLPVRPRLLARRHADTKCFYFASKAP